MILNISEEYVREVCCNCGMSFALTKERQGRLRESKQTFYCPSGHPQSYNESETERLRKQLNVEREQRQAAEIREREKIAEAQILESKLKRLKNRVKNGVCTKCNRHFANLHAHFKTKHPEKK